MRILLVEDEPLNRKVIRAMLEPVGAHLDEAEDGPTGLSLFEKHDYDVVLMDLRMPGMNGLEAIEKIRARDERKGAVPVVVVTADTAVNIRGKCLAAGADGVMFKPVSADGLFGAIGDAVASRTSKRTAS